MNKTKGFTLIELVIVVAIIGIIAAAVLTSINPFENQKISRDTIRVSQLSSIAQALELYFSENKTYPSSPSSNLITTLGKYNSKLTLSDPSGCGIVYTFNSSTNSFTLVSISESKKYNIPKGQNSIELLPPPYSGVTAPNNCPGVWVSGTNNIFVIRSQ